MASYHEWGGTATPPTMAIVDWRDVPTWTEFEILRDAFAAAGVPTIVCDPRELVFANGALTAQGTRIDLVYRRVLVNDILAKPLECRALVDACAARAVCMANSFRCKLAHKKAFFAILTDPAYAIALFHQGARRDSSARSVDARARRCGNAEGRLAGRSAGARARVARAPGAQAERRVRRQGRQSRMGDDRGRVGHRPRIRARGSLRHVDCAGAHSRPARNLSRSSMPRAASPWPTCWWTWRRTCFAAAWAATSRG